MNAAPDRAHDDDRQAVRAFVRGGLFLAGALVLALIGGALSLAYASWGFVALMSIPILGLGAVGVVSIITGLVLGVSSLASPK
jgi:hypothetical protein